MRFITEIQAWLTETYGFPVPRLFAEVTRIVLTFMEEGYHDPFDYLGWELTPALHLFSNGQAGHDLFARHPWTPIEMFSFGWSGTDGEHYGYLIHAPELKQSDYPIVEFEPMNDFGLNLVGPDTRSGLEGLLSLIVGAEYATALHKHHELAFMLDLHPTAQKADWYQNRRAVIPAIPDGWRYEPTSDGVGVLAPAHTFSPNHEADSACDYEIQAVESDLQTILRKAEIALEQGYPATALAIIRESYWQQYDVDNFNQYAPLWSQAYADLGRPLLADTVDRILKNPWAMQQGEDSSASAAESSDESSVVEFDETSGSEFQDETIVPMIAASWLEDI
ncbi:MAG: hypothetical protein F6J95_005520 [Leptolyngbya sp. SIO1E4]|nr:hypothetical protein [Leptolyngbya sp. SIO1E4]